MKISTLISVAFVTTAQLAAAVPYALPDLDPQVARAVQGIEVGGVGELHRNFLRKRQLDGSKQLSDTDKGWAGGIQAGNKDKQMVNRLEIRQLYNLQGGRVYDLYILALRRTMIRKPTDKNSWWQIAGVHGRPFTSWNGRGPGAPGTQGQLFPQFTGTGYCTHGSTLFPTWHRPYLAYFEEILWASAYLEIQVVKDPEEKKLWEDALEQFRIPYWDWGLDNAQLPFMVRNAAHTFRFFPGKKKEDFPNWGNPLYTFFFQSGTYNSGTNFGNDRFRRWRRTLRHPKDESEGVGDNIGAANTALRSNGPGIRQQIHELLLREGGAANWRSFSNRVGNGGTNVESIHDGIHVYTGGNLGHMSSVPYSSFDPVFFLHHTNVDRLFAIYQAINYRDDQYVTPQRNGGGTYGVDPGRTDTAYLPLEPWLKRGGGQFNSMAVRDTAVFGYGYPEVPKHLYPNSPNGLRTYTMGQVERLYGNGIASASASTKRKRDYGAVVSDVEQGIDNSINANKYYEWRVDCTADSQALGGSYSIHFFLGKPDRDYKKWFIQPEFVGDYAVFSHAMGFGYGVDPGTVNTTIFGSVPLTDAMVKSFGSANLTSLNPQDAIPFLVKRLRWRATDSNGRPIKIRKIKGLKVSVSISHATLPTAEKPYTQYGEWTLLTEITRKIGRDGGPDKIGIPNLSASSSIKSTASQIGRAHV